MPHSTRIGFHASPVVLALSCFGVLAIGGLLWSGCAGGLGSNTAGSSAPKVVPLKLAVTQVDQLSHLDEKIPDGQYLVVKLTAENLSNETIILDPGNFMLQNITNNEQERYSQPMERGLLQLFIRAYGDAAKDKLLDYTPVNLYPRLQLERFLIFMVPSKAQAREYQILFTPKRITVPLVTPGVTIVNDQRNNPNDGSDSTESDPTTESTQQ